VQRLAELEHHVVRGVDHVVDGPRARAPEALAGATRARGRPSRRARRPRGSGGRGPDRRCATETPPDSHLRRALLVLEARGLPRELRETTFPSPSCASSRASPTWESRSPRFAVTSTSSVASSSPSAVTNGSPGWKSPSISMMPAWSVPEPNSLAEHNMPCDTSPRILAFLIAKPPGSTAPTGANGYQAPARTFGAPHTTCTEPLAAVHRAERQTVRVRVRLRLRTFRPPRRRALPRRDRSTRPARPGAPGGRRSRGSGEVEARARGPGASDAETFTRRTARGSACRSRRRCAGR
jgi:hypothetical protein